jgi:hypothetical protein
MLIDFLEDNTAGQKELVIRTFETATRVARLVRAGRDEAVLDQECGHSPLFRKSCALELFRGTVLAYPFEIDDLK